MPHVYLKQQVKRCKNTSPINRNITKEGIQCWSLNALELIAIDFGASLETLFVSLSVASDSHDNFAFILKLKGCLASGELQCTPHQICHSSRYPIYNVICITPISKKYGGLKQGKVWNEWMWQNHDLRLLFSEIGRILEFRISMLVEN